MTDQPQDQQVPLMDIGNQFIREYPTSWTGQPVEGPDGARLIFTVRSGPATVTLVLRKEAAEALAASVADGASQLPSLQIFPAGAVPLVPPNGGQQ